MIQQGYQPFKKGAADECVGESRTGVRIVRRFNWLRVAAWAGPYFAACGLVVAITVPWMP
jgi:hypothetical protein